MKSVSGLFFKGQSSRRSVHITDFGRTFCQVAFPPHHLTGEFEAIDLDPSVEVIPPELDADGDIGAKID